MGISAAAAGPQMVGRITENGNRVGEFTIIGTAFLIVLIGVFVGLVGTVIVVGSDPWLRWMGPLQGLGIALTTFSLSGQQDNFGSTDFLILEPASLNVAMFSALHLAFGFSVTGLYWLLDRRLPPADATAEQPIWLAASIPSLLGLLLLMALLVLPGFSGSDATYQVTAILVIVFASTIVRLLSSLSISVPSWLARGATFTGYGSMALLLIVGLTRTVDQIQRLL